MMKSHVRLRSTFTLVLFQIRISNPMSTVFTRLMVAMQTHTLRKKQSWISYMNLTVRCILRSLVFGEVISIKKIDREAIRIYSLSGRAKHCSGLVLSFSATLSEVNSVAQVRQDSGTYSQWKIFEC